MNHTSVIMIRPKLDLDMDRMRRQLADLTDIDPGSFSPAILPLVFEAAELHHAFDAQRWNAWCAWKQHP